MAFTENLTDTLIQSLDLKGNNHFLRHASVLIRKPLITEWRKRRLLEQAVLEALSESKAITDLNVDTYAYSLSRETLAAKTKDVLLAYTDSLVTKNFIKSVRDKYEAKREAEFIKRLNKYTPFINAGIIQIYKPLEHPFDDALGGFYIKSKLSYTDLVKSSFISTATEAEAVNVSDVTQVIIKNQCDDASTARVTIRNVDRKYNYDIVNSNSDIAQPFNSGELIFEANDEIRILLPNAQSELRTAFFGYINRIIDKDQGGFHFIDLECECLYKMLRVNRANIHPSVNQLENGALPLQAFQLPDTYFNQPVESSFFLLAESFSNMYSQISDSEEIKDHPLIKYLVLKLFYFRGYPDEIINTLLSQYTQTVYYGLEASETRKGLDLKLSDLYSLSKQYKDITTKQAEARTEKKAASTEILKRSVTATGRSSATNLVISGSVAVFNYIIEATSSLYNSFADSLSKNSAYITDKEARAIYIKYQDAKKKEEDAARSLKRVQESISKLSTTYASEYLAKGGNVRYELFREQIGSTVTLAKPIVMFLGTRQLSVQRAFETATYNSNWVTCMEFLKSITNPFQFIVHTDMGTESLYIGPTNQCLHDPTLYYRSTSKNFTKTSIFDKDSDYCLGKNKVKNLDAHTDDSYITNWLPICGQWTDMPKGTMDSNINKIILSMPESVDKFGWRMKQEQTYSQIKNAVQLYFYALALLERQNSLYHRASCTVWGNSDILLNRSVYVPTNETVYYIQSITHTLTAGGAFESNLDLVYGRKPLFKTALPPTVSYTKPEDVEKDRDSVETLYKGNNISRFFYFKMSNIFENANKKAMVDDWDTFVKTRTDPRGYIWEEYVSSVYEEAFTNMGVTIGYEPYKKFVSDFNEATTNKDITEALKLVRNSKYFQYLIPAGFMTLLDLQEAQNKSYNALASQKQTVDKPTELEYKEIKDYRRLLSTIYIIDPFKIGGNIVKYDDYVIIALYNIFYRKLANSQDASIRESVGSLPNKLILLDSKGKVIARANESSYNYHPFYVNNSVNLTQFISFVYQLYGVTIAPEKYYAGSQINQALAPMDKNSLTEKETTSLNPITAVNFGVLGGLTVTTYLKQLYRSKYKEYYKKLNIKDNTEDLNKFLIAEVDRIAKLDMGIGI